MSDKLYSDVFFILLALIVAALLGFLIGWFLRSVKLNALNKALDTCNRNNEDLKNKLNPDRTKAEKKTTSKSTALNEKIDLNNNNEIKLSSTYDAGNLSTAATSFNKANAKNALGKLVKENDLKLVEGIGPKIEELLNKDGITTWKQLGESPVSRIQKILKDAGDRFSIHKPDTWPKQSTLAAKGKWEELKKLQNQLDGGKETK